ncbi:MAG: phosphotransferase [Acetobacteraceae bacterium]|nr:phosphotransferase [Acetobacteraceae bacterium]
MPIGSAAINPADWVPHQGAMCLLEGVEAFSETAIVCRTWSHLTPENPLRRGGRLSTVAGIEYGLQAAALHGAIVAGAPQQAGFAAALRAVSLQATRLDNPEWGALRVRAALLARDSKALIYVFQIEADSGRLVLSGRATIALP